MKHATDRRLGSREDQHLADGSADRCCVFQQFGDDGVAPSGLWDIVGIEFPGFRPPDFTQPSQGAGAPFATGSEGLLASRLLP
jgi:hypothetical protein